MGGKVIAFVPALNEEENIGLVLKALVEARREGLISGIVVVDDGSTDGTAGVAESYGAHVIRHGENRGNFEAFITAAKYCVEQGADVMFKTDADMLNLDAGKIRAFIEDFDGKPDMWMSRASSLQQREDGRTFWCDFAYSGFRLLRREALEYILQGLEDKGSRVYGYYRAAHSVEHYPPAPGKGRGFDLALEYVISQERITGLSGLNLTSRYPSDQAHARVAAEIKAVLDFMTRVGLADKLRVLLRLRRHDPEDPRVKGMGGDKLVETASRLSDVEIERIRDGLPETGRPRAGRLKR